MASVTVLVREAIDSGLLFTAPVYSASIPENIPNVTIVTIVNTVGHRLNEPLKYTLLNPGGRFTIRPTCGVVLSTGVPFDREEKSTFELVVEVSREDEILRVSRVTVRVQVCMHSISFLSTGPFLMWYNVVLQLCIAQSNTSCVFWHRLLKFCSLLIYKSQF